jgi:hypothetical protein
MSDHINWADRGGRVAVKVKGGLVERKVGEKRKERRGGMPFFGGIRA